MSFIKRSKRNGKVYLSEVESQWVDGKCVQKHIRYIDKEVDGEKVVSILSNDIQVNSVKIQGPLLLLHNIAFEPNSLNETFQLPRYLNVLLVETTEPTPTESKA